MSVQDSAQALIAHSNDFAQNGTAATTVVADDLGRATQNVARIFELVVESSARANDLLGSGHAGMGGIGATANGVSQKAEEVQGAIQNVLNLVLDLTQSINTYSNTMSQVGHQLLQGG